MARQAVYSAFSLILTFFGLATLYLLWGNSFVACLQILIYTGAIVVLFVFVVMILHRVVQPPPFSGNGLYVSLCLVASWLFSVILLRTLNSAKLWQVSETAHDMRSVATLLFTEYLWPFEVLSVFLLALIVAVCTLIRTEKGAGR